MKPQWNRYFAAMTLTTLLAGPGQFLNGAGFILQEQSISGLGVGFASGAAGMGDNSSMFFNPATLSLVSGQQVTGGLHAIMPEAEYHDTGTTSLSILLTQQGAAMAYEETQGPDDTSDKVAVVPNIYYSIQLNDQLFLGVSVTTPYGLATKYEDGWVGRYVALETDLMTVNSNVAVAYKISDKVTIAAGFSVLYADAVLSNAIDFGLALQKYVAQSIAGGSMPDAPTMALYQDVTVNRGTTKYDGRTELTGDDLGFGYNLGVLFTPSESTRIGLHYRSNVKLTVDGDADFTVGALESVFGSLYHDQGGSVDLNLPDTAQASIHQYLTPQWAIMADVFHTWWSKFEKLEIVFEDGEIDNLVIPENWDNSWRFSVGTTYDLNESLQLRAGLVYDESPVPSADYRSPRIPDEDRYWITLGLGYRISDSLKLDVAYVHIFVDDPLIDNPTHTTGTYLRGTMDAYVNILSVGGSFSF